MTDTTLEDVIVTGQRRSPGGGPFPILPQTILAPAQFETPEIEKGDPVEMPPCQYPPFRKRWDADAAAVQSVSEFLDAAENLGGNDVGPNGPDLANREFGALLRGAPRGRVSLGNISWGDPQLLPNGETNPNASSVIFDETGITGYNVRGFIHNHPGGNLTPTPQGPDGSGDWGVFEYYRSIVESVGGSPGGLTMYIVAYSSATGGYVVMAYDWNEGHINEGREVNPDAAPCPA